MLKKGVLSPPSCINTHSLGVLRPSPPLKKHLKRENENPTEPSSSYLTVAQIRFVKISKNLHSFIQITFPDSDTSSFPLLSLLAISLPWFLLLSLPLYIYIFFIFLLFAFNPFYHTTLPHFLFDWWFIKIRVADLKAAWTLIHQTRYCIYIYFFWIRGVNVRVNFCVFRLNSTKSQLLHLSQLKLGSSYWSRCSEPSSVVEILYVCLFFYRSFNDLLRSYICVL